MKKLVLLAVLLVVSMSFAGNVIETAVIAFTNNTAAKLDTLQSNDSMWCVIDQRVNGKLADNITLFLPDVLASGDSATIYLNPITGNYGAPDAVNGNSAISKRDRQGDQVDAPFSTGTSYVSKSRTLGTYYYGAGPVYLSYVPSDSANSNRAKFVIVETAGSANAAKITDCDSLATSNAYVVWEYTE